MVFKYFSNSKKLHEYKYSGSDNSLSYTYLLSPLASFLVEYVPKTIS